MPYTILKTGNYGCYPADWFSSVLLGSTAEDILARFFIG
jgi:hypothetical protein